MGLLMELTINMDLIGKEEQDDDLSGNQLNWLDFGAASGRWMNINP